jgi:RNA polymerase sigma factor (sigma-70 family)
MSNAARHIDPGESDETDRSVNEQQAAFLLMLKAQEPALRKVACMFCKREDDRQELIQAIVYRLWAGFASFRRESSEATWVCAVAKQTARMRHRAKRDWIEFTDEISEGDHPLTTEDTKNVNVLLDIQQLRDSDKTILLLLMQGYEYREVSDMLGIAPFTLRNRIQRLRQRLTGKLIL